MIERSILIVMALATSCGISEEEHNKRLQQALDSQSKKFSGEMTKAKRAFSKEKKSLEEANKARVAGRDKRITGLETKLKEVNTELSGVSMNLEQLKADREQAMKVAETFKEKLKAMVDSGKLEVVMRKGRMTLKLPDAVLFPVGSKRLKKDGKEALTSVAEVLRDVKDRSFLIAGHTDNVPTKRGGAFRTNWELSSARALSVVHLLIKNEVDPKRLTAAGYGEFDPIADNETKEGRTKNRRLEIILMPSLQGI